MKVPSEQGIDRIDGVPEDIDRLQVGVASRRGFVKMLESVLVVAIITRLILCQKINQEGCSHSSIGADQQFHVFWQVD